MCDLGLKRPAKNGRFHGQLLEGPQAFRGIPGKVLLHSGGVRAGSKFRRRFRRVCGGFHRGSCCLQYPERAMLAYPTEVGRCLSPFVSMTSGAFIPEEQPTTCLGTKAWPPRLLISTVSHSGIQLFNVVDRGALRNEGWVGRGARASKRGRAKAGQGKRGWGLHGFAIGRLGSSLSSG